jgi:hypothetical protein
LLKKALSAGRSKMSGCKASDILSREAHSAVRRMAKDEENEAAGRFGRLPTHASKACDPLGRGLDGHALVHSAASREMALAVGCNSPPGAYRPLCRRIPAQAA